MMITEKELQIRKMRVIRMAFTLFCKNGIDGVTISDISKHSGVSEASIYRYFNTKAELMSHVQTVLWTEIADAFFMSISHIDDYNEKNGLDQVAILLSGFYCLYHDNADYVLFAYAYRLYLIKQGLKMPDNRYSDILSPVHKAFVSAFQNGKDDGSILASQSSDDLYYALWGLMRGYVVKIVVYERMYDGKNPWLSRFDLVCSMILSSLKNGIQITEYPL